MKYMALIYVADEAYPNPGEPGFDEMVAGYKHATETYIRDGVLVAGEPLKDADTAKTFRVRKGETMIMDGPFAETKEQLGGFYILDCASLDEAMDYARLIPAAHYGTIELRPLGDMS